MTSKERVACPDCSLEQRLPEIADHEVARCRRCQRLLKVPDAQSKAAFALTLGALLLWIPGWPCAPAHSDGRRRQPQCQPG